MKEILAVNPDSILAVVSKGIIDEAEDSVGEGLLFQISSALHNPPAGFVKKGSFRTPDRYGSLQFTLFAKGDYCIARIDIDDQGGFKHLMDVLGGKFDMRETTHPYDINQLLVYYQRIDPGYRLRP